MMYTPLIIFSDIFPQEILNQIQQYLPVHDNISNALKKYYDELHDKKTIDDEIAWARYVYPNCACPNCPNNGRHKIYRRKDCNPCFEHEINVVGDVYANDKYCLVIKNNPQYKKIAYNYDSDDSIDDMYWYDDRHIWLE